MTLYSPSRPCFFDEVEDIGRVVDISVQSSSYGLAAVTPSHIIEETILMYIFELYAADNK